MPSSRFRVALGTALLLFGAAIGYGAHDQLMPPSTPAADKPPPNPRPGRRILYYKNPMGLPDTSPVPKKDAMGMDYLPVYEGEEEEDGSVRVSPGRIQMLGVRTEAAGRREIVQIGRATGTVQFDETQQTIVSTRFEAYIEKLLVARTGERVRRGQILAEVYSPELLRTQLLEQSAPNSRGDAAAIRLRNFGIAEEDIERVRREGRALRTLPIRSPRDGVVVEKKAIEGMRASAGDPLYRIVDLDRMWIIADVFEQDLAGIKPGQPATATLLAYPGRVFTGRVSFIYPTVSPTTRTGRVRIELPNPDGALKADMFATVELAMRSEQGPVLAIPESAVLDTGVRRAVLVETGEGRFAPREVKLGARGNGYVAVLEGIEQGEKVVVSANFLIDAESNLKSALRGFARGAEEKQGTHPGGEHRPAPETPR
jgi:Cu(I)/Ag(I) efflux system membrane fusion protein